MQSPTVKSALYARGLFRTNLLRLPMPTHTPAEVAQVSGMLE